MTGFLSPELLRWVLLAGAFWVFYSIVRKTAGIEFADYIATWGRDNKYHGSPATTGITLGCGLSVFTIVTLLPHAMDDLTGFGVVLGLCLAFLGGSYAFNSNVKSRAGQTVTVVEPADDPDALKKTTTTTPAAPLPTDAPVPVKIVGGAGVDKAPLKVTSKRRPR